MAVSADGKSYQLVMFDLDDTLAASKSPLTDEMVDLMRRLLGEASVCIISGGNESQFRNQVLDRIGDFDGLAGLHLMPTCGTLSQISLLQA